MDLLELQYKLGKKKFRIGNSTIRYIGKVDVEVVRQVIKNYKVLTKELKVSPDVDIYAEPTELSSKFGGLYTGGSNKIDIFAKESVITTLAHEMRHAYQYYYRPEQFFNTRVTNGYEYINCPIEVDARKYAIDYCHRVNCLEEMNQWIEIEKMYTRFLNGLLTAEEVGIDHQHFQDNPIYPMEYTREGLGYEHEKLLEDELTVFQKLYWKIGGTFEKITSGILLVLKYTSVILFSISVVLMLLEGI